VPTPAGDDQDAAATVLYVRLLGPFSISCRGRAAGPWERPTAKRLCELVFLSPGRRITRQAACEALFPNLRGDAAAKALYQALSRARSALIDLGPPGSQLLRADRGSVWAEPTVPSTSTWSLMRSSCDPPSEPSLAPTGTTFFQPP
jgi:hypothetical protein